MKIEQVSWRGFVIPFNNPYSTAHGSEIVRYGMLIFLRASDGTTGVGEASPIGPGSLSEITSAGRYLEIFSANLLNQQLPFSSVDLANKSEIPSTIRFGVETAVADLFGYNFLLLPIFILAVIKFNPFYIFSTNLVFGGVL